MRLGVFGGTFDPPHLGHLVVAQDAALALDLDRVLFVPAGTPPHKRDRTLTRAEVRLAMLEAAVTRNDRFGVEQWELGRQGPSYTVDTLRHLRRAQPAAELWLLVGADQWAEFSTWRDPEEIRAHAGIGVLSRGGETTQGQADAAETRGLRHPLRTAQQRAGRVEVVRATRIDISSSEIRRRVGVGESIRYLVPDAVIEIIFREQLYR